MENQLRYDCFNKGIFIDPMTSGQSLQELISRIRPVKSSFELIRVGGESDGGYLVPDDLEGIRYCLSPGVDQIADFEKDLLRRGIRSHLADYSVVSPPPGLDFASFTRKFLGAVTHQNHISMADWCKDLGLDDESGDLLLQMDIEGSEYEVLLTMAEELLARFRIMVIEFHNIESWGQQHFFALVAAAFSRLLEHFNVVHIHPNNAMGLVNLGGIVAPRVFEVTFHRKDRGEILGNADTFPHPLDRPNLQDRPDLVLPINWYK